MAIKLSLCMIVKNEEKVLGRCLKSISKEIDEIIVVDTGSTDDTKRIAESFGAHVYDFTWINDFAAARNFSFSLSKGDYIIWLDADDVISEKSLSELNTLKTELDYSRPDVVMCPYIAATDEFGNSTLSYYRERIIKNGVGFKWEGFVHECIAPRGKIINSEFSVMHAKPKERTLGVSDRNLMIYIKNISAGKTLSARDKFYFGRELYYNRLYSEAIAVLNESIEDSGVWGVNAIAACSVLSDCFRAKNETQNALFALLKSFEFGEPRAEILYKTGEIFMNENKLKEAIFWFESATKANDHLKDGDFEQPQFKTLYPYLGLTHCYGVLGQIDKALEYHKKAYSLAPNHPSVIYNEEYFKRLYD